MKKRKSQYSTRDYTKKVYWSGDKKDLRKSFPKWTMIAWALIDLTLGVGLIWLAIIAVLNSVVSAYYYTSIIRTMYFRNADDSSLIRISKPNLFALSVTSVSILVLGLWPAGLFEAASTAAKSLFN